MIGDVIILKKEYLTQAKSIYNSIKSKLTQDKFVIAIGGESGSGKSVSAKALSLILSENNITNHIIHQDDYFFLPPKTNDLRRRENLANVGIHEVNLEKLSENIHQFKQNQKSIIKPIVNYNENTIAEEKVNLEHIQVLLIEGTYVLSLQELEYKIFIERTYKDTLQQRKNRNRDIIDDFGERVLEIEHHIIKKYHTLAHGIIDKNYNFKIIKQ